MKIITYNLKVKKTARFCVRPASTAKADTVWLLIHGYAQLAEDFLSEFDFIKNDGHMLAAPEGLSRFYFRNKIGASWMTKEDRENEIKDYTEYLDSLMIKINEEYDLSGAVFNLLGFSQGVHTAVRYFIRGRQHFKNLILCSSDFPADADFGILRQRLNDSEMYFIHGTSDSAVSNDTFDSSLSLLKNNGISFHDIAFEGDHVLNKKVLSDLFCK
ncbi:MAG: hypothetical protein JSS91_09175 [Bacteroidetes bacterium]|nr:hypothetical protein [Bacteroidota bacterium]